MYEVAAQLREAAANNKSDIFIQAVHPQTNKQFVGATQSFGRSIKNVNVKFDPTSIRVAATKYPAAECKIAKCIFFGYYLR